MATPAPSFSNGTPHKIIIGVLALQGAFAEHHAILLRLSPPSPSSTLSPLLVRTAADLAQCSALIIPGGESTTMALIAARTGLLGELRAFCRDPERAVWGTCAGCILLAEEASAVKRGGQELFGGVGVRVMRNGYGTQLESFEVMLDIPALREPERPFGGVFIRAPIIQNILPSSADTEVVARVSPSCLPDELADDAEANDYTVVALRQGRKFVTTFHPELTKDERLHEFFVRRCVLGLGVGQ